MKKIDSSNKDESSGPQPFAILPLIVALLIMLAIIAYPKFLVSSDGVANHGSMVFLMWAMSSGFVAGIGFVPHHRIIRWLLSGKAQLVALLVFLIQTVLR